METKNDQIIKFIEESEKENMKIFNSGEYFNIFNELSIATDEIKHSSKLKALINPNGFHGCGDFFYQKFLQKIGIETKKEIFAWLNDTKNMIIHAEYFIDNRNHKVKTNEKYYAKKQEEQLKRYSDFASEKY